MQIVRAIADATVYDQSGGLAYRLEVGQEYVLYDREAALGRQQGAIELIESLDRRLRFYKGEPLSGERLLLPFIGRLGDIFVTASCLQALIEKYPDARIDIAATEKTLEALSLLSAIDQPLSYPLLARDLDQYDYYMTFEDVDAQPHCTDRSCGDVFSACLHTPLPRQPAPISIPATLREDRLIVGTCKPSVAVFVGKPNCLKTYPADLTIKLVRELIDNDLDVYLIGQAEENNCAWGNDDEWKNGVGQQSGAVTNLLNQTASVAELAAVISQMDAVVTSDSLPLHLAGSLGVTTVALFTSTNKVIASDYASVTGVQSEAACSPCSIANGSCPLGHVRCIAHNDGALAPKRIALLLRSLITSKEPVS